MLRLTPTGFDSSVEATIDYNLPEPGYHSIEGHPLAFR